MAASKVGMGKSIGKIVLHGILFLLFSLCVMFVLYQGYTRLVSPEEYLVTAENRFDYQRHYECSGYACAYVLRSLGHETDGLTLYKGFSGKNPDGTLAPGYLWENLRTMGYRSQLLFGSVSDLKYHVSRGVPVVALIRVNTAQPYLHYVAVVGYDKDTFYLADSLPRLTNAEGPHYNRTVSVEEFKQLWTYDDFAVDHIYLTIGL